MVKEEEDKQANFEKADQSTQVIRHTDSLAEKGSIGGCRQATTDRYEGLR